MLFCQFFCNSDIYSYGYLHAFSNDSLIALRTLLRRTIRISFELNFVFLTNGLGLNFNISSAVNVDGANISPPIPNDDFSQSLLIAYLFIYMINYKRIYSFQNLIINFQNV